MMVNIILSISMISFIVINTYTLNLTQLTPSQFSVTVSYWTLGLLCKKGSNITYNILLLLQFLCMINSSTRYHHNRKAISNFFILSYSLNIIPHLHPKYNLYKVYNTLIDITILKPIIGSNEAMTSNDLAGQLISENCWCHSQPMKVLYFDHWSEILSRQLFQY